MQLLDQNVDSPNFRKLIDLVAGTTEDYAEYARKQLSDPRSKVNCSWQQALCSHLLYVFEPQTSLKVALEQFMGCVACTSLAKVNNSGEDLLHVLLRMYICVEGHDSAAERLRTFKNVHVTPETSKTQEFHVQWLV